MALHRAPLLLLLLSSCVVLHGASVTISGRVVLPQLKAGSTPPEAAAAARLVLDGAFAASAAPDGAFVFDAVAPGEHSIEVFHRDFVFSAYRVAVGADVRAMELRYPGAPPLPASHPLDVAPVARAIYFEERPPSSVWAYTRSPMVLMMGGFFVLMMCMKQMDPEALKEAQGDAPELPSLQDALGQLFGSGAPTTAAAPKPRAGITRN